LLRAGTAAERAPDRLRCAPPGVIRMRLSGVLEVRLYLMPELSVRCRLGPVLLLRASSSSTASPFASFWTVWTVEPPVL